MVQNRIKITKIAIIAGEDSGDLLAADLISKLKEINPSVEFFGVGGGKMQATGMRLIASNKEFAIMGIAEVIKKLPKLLKLRKKIINEMIAEKPDVFIGVDAPDLNFPIEKKLKKHGIKIIHYVSPSVWAWRPKRVNKISQLTDLVMTLFPFEPKYYAKAGGNAQFVGHPLAQSIELVIDKNRAKQELKLNTNHQVLAVLPGSRSNELKAHTDIFIKAALKLKEKIPQLQIISANTNQAKMQYIQECANRNNLPIKIFKDATQVLKAADFTLLASGTVALEAMFCKTPMVVGYQLSKITYGIVKSFNMMLLPYFSLPNVLYGGFLVPEILQENMTVENLFQELLPLLNIETQNNLRQEFTRLHQDLLSPEMDAAKAVEQFLKQCQL
ncbi:MAG: lipid-A-disaccharide synthase [Proteobacteria bacterium]|nr:lipid-A-disaccharide synthase [Pseudomonadota bacterium]